MLFGKVGCSGLDRPGYHCHRLIIAMFGVTKVSIVGLCGCDGVGQ